MNDPDDTMAIPIVEAHAEPNGAAARSPSPPKDASQRQGPTISRPTIAADAGPIRFEPFRFESFQFESNVFGAIRRYRFMVLAVAILAMVAAVGYSLMAVKVYRAQAFITMPQQVSLQGAQQANAGQYLDSQVLVLKSQNVAQLAASIANATLHIDNLTTGDFFGSDSSLVISPPTSAAAGTFGATVIGVSFAASTPQIAQVGTNAVLQAYDQTRTATIRSQDNAVITGINYQIGGTNFQLAALSGKTSATALNQVQQLLAQRGVLINQRAQAIVNEQIDLAQQPSAQSASEPATPANHKWALDGGIGLVIGILIGSALAFARASRRRGNRADQQGPVQS